MSETSDKSETVGRLTREFVAAYRDKRIIPNDSQWLIAAALDRLAADVAAVKEACGRNSWADAQPAAPQPEPSDGSRMPPILKDLPRALGSDAPRPNRG
jgi:hypothetical protein